MLRLCVRGGIPRSNSAAYVLKLDRITVDQILFFSRQHAEPVVSAMVYFLLFYNNRSYL